VHVFRFERADDPVERAVETEESAPDR